MYRQSEENLLNSNISSTCSQNMVNFGPLTAEICWRVWGKFQRVSRLGFVAAPTSLNEGQPNFARCLVVSWAGTLYTHFRALLPPNGILPAAKFTLHPSLAFSYIGSVTARHSSSGCQPKFVAWFKEITRNGITELSPPIFGRAHITLGIGPHSNYAMFQRHCFIS